MGRSLHQCQCPHGNAKPSPLGWPLYQNVIQPSHQTSTFCTTNTWYENSGEWWSHGRAPDCQSRDGGSIPPTAVSKIRQFRLPHICLCLSEDTIKNGGPFCLVSSKRSHTGGICVTCSGLTYSREKDNSCISPSVGCLEETTCVCVCVCVYVCGVCV